ncbi:L-ascorbate oxidase [Violaceomyces palustris]|uniref:L-ascorbate oxidase n=1 Tax=Violaceomyces palustris TaxID=1673888 RepID=A0ACD0P067_9BASI|nr:L-ascorbate oxidase [Violaceomyces palustris]
MKPIETYILLSSLFLACLGVKITHRLHDDENGQGRSRGDDSVPIRRESLFLTSTTLWADCNPQTEAVVINGTFPGPTIRAMAGERLIINVTNAMTDRNATVHWHGLSMRLNPASDGTPLISQWPIAPGHWFEYDIKLAKEDVGTYFYHSHVGLQAMTAQGALIIEDRPNDWGKNGSDRSGGKKREGERKHDKLSKNGRSVPGAPYAYDEDRVMVIGDYYHATNADKILKGLLASPFVWPGSANALLVNGMQGQLTCNQTSTDLLDPSIRCPPSVSDQVSNLVPGGCDYSTIEVEHAKTYRLRFIGAQSLMYQHLAILNHTMDLIEADGTYLEKVEVDYLEIASGQRYSVLLKTKSKEQVRKETTDGIYWMRLESRWRAGPSGWARIKYTTTKREASKPPFIDDNRRILANETFGWISSSLSPLRTSAATSAFHYEKVPDDSEVTRSVLINGQQIAAGANLKGVAWNVNDYAYSEETTSTEPYLVEIYKGTKSAPGYDKLDEDDDDGQCYDAKQHIYLARPGEVIDIVLINQPSNISQQTEVHPWHLHSRKHWVIAMGQGDYDPDEVRRIRSEGKGGFKDPILRDTTNVYASPGASYLGSSSTVPKGHQGGWAVLRYRVEQEDAGVYPLHCHWFFHQVMGMSTTWALSPDKINQLVKVYDNQQYLFYGRNVRAEV